MISKNKILLLMIGVVLLAMPVRGEGKKSLEELELTEIYMNAVKELHLQNNSEKAISLFISIIDRDSTHAASHFQLSRLIASPTKSLEHSLAAHKYDTTNIWYQNSLSLKYVENKMFNEAILIANKTLEQNPSNIDPYTALANIHINAGRIEDAEKTLLDYVSKFGSTEESLYFLVQVYSRQTPSPTLLSKLEKLAKDNMHSELPYVVLSEKQFALKLNTKALETLKKAEKISPYNLRIILMMSDYYLGINDVPNLIKYTKKAFANDQFSLDSKISLIEKLLFSKYFYQNYLFEVGEIVQLLKQYHTDDLRANTLVAQHYINCGMLKNAENQFQEMIENGIADKDTYYKLIGLASYQKQYDKVIEYCDLLTKAIPETERDNTMQKSYAYMEMAQYENAIEVLGIYLKNDINDKKRLSEIYGMIGDVYNRWGKSQESFNNYQKSLKLNRNNIVVLNNYSYNLDNHKIIIIR